MFKTIQIIALLQGIFLIIVLLKNKTKYLKPAFWLLIGAVVSILLYILGDDDNNLFLKNTDLFFFDKSLFITFLFLFIKYYISKSKQFHKADLIFFIPCFLYFFVEIFEILSTQENFFIELLELFVELTFLIYLLSSIYILIKNRRHHWMLLFLIPLVLLISLSIVNDILLWFNYEKFILSTDISFGSYILIIIAFLFYAITLKLVISPDNTLPKTEKIKYLNSNLNTKQISKYKQDIIRKMEVEKAFKDQKLSIHKFADELQIPRQYISEILNNHMQTSFQDFVNAYRVEEFIKHLKNDQYAHYTLMAIANDVGFNSKATFNSTFKKIKGLTPSEYKKNKL